MKTTSSTSISISKSYTASLDASRAGHASSMPTPEFSKLSCFGLESLGQPVRFCNCFRGNWFGSLTDSPREDISWDPNPWGMPTVDCLRAVCQACPGQPVIASGGVRHGLDAAKAIRLGAVMVSAAGPMLARLMVDDGDLDTPNLEDFVTDWKQQMALTLFLTGAPNLAAFGGVEMRYDGDLIPPR